MTKNTGRLPPWVGGAVAAVVVSGVVVWLTQRAFLTVWSAWLAGSILFSGAYMGLWRWAGSRVRQPAPEFRSTAASGSPDDSAHVISRQTSRMAIGSAEVSFLVDRLHESVDRNRQSADDIASAAEQLTQTTIAISQQAQDMTSQYQRAAGTTRQGQENVQRNAEQVERLNREVQDASHSLSKLQEKADAIQRITEVIENIADNINLLALNAAIEAARAGEQGRGFAVVADEVRNLAQKTAHATDDIANMLAEVRQETGITGDIMAKVTQRCSAVVGGVQEFEGTFAAIQTEIDSTAQSLATVDHSLQEHSQNVASIAQSIEHIRVALTDSGQSTQHISAQADRLSENAEIIYRELAAWDTRTFDQVVLKEAQQAATRVAQVLEEAIRQGVLSTSQVFSRDYQPIPNTDPQKYHTAYDGFTDKAFPDIQEAILQRHKAIVYAGAVDINGYFPTHNKCFDHPVTGDYAVDLVKSRSKRIFNDPTGLRCGSHTDSFLLQTYKRDTGEIMHDLSVPIYVDGQHWGGFRVGFAAEKSPL